jgi:alanine-glyoxylate transaminase/serine-glyoxylate transaminase/serine-pyruvate transaminase
LTSSYMNELSAPQKVLLGPGPSSVHPRVLAAMASPVMGHLDPAFFQVMDDVCDMLRIVFNTENKMTVPISSTGTGAMEAACANIIEPGDEVLICRNGYFGIRLADIAERCGATVHLMDTPWGKAVDPQALRDELKKLPAMKAVGMVHAETSTGVLSDVKELAEIVHEAGALAIVDAVTSLGGHEMRMDDWGIDVCYSATQKCLGAPPGLAPISLSTAAMDVVVKRSTKVQSFYFNLKDLETYWNQTRAYHHTSPINMTYALRESLRMMMEEGLDNRIQRHARVAAGFRAGAEALGLTLLAEEGHRLNPLTTVSIPEGIDDGKVRRTLLNDYEIEIGGGLGEFAGKAWRVGLMGESSRERNVFALLSALETILSKEGYEVAFGASLSAAQRAIATFDE